MQRNIGRGDDETVKLERKIHKKKKDVYSLKGNNVQEGKEASPNTTNSLTRNTKK